MANDQHINQSINQVYVAQQQSINHILDLKWQNRLKVGTNK